jgi:RNase P/RNase MRP subunit POP5
MPVRSVRRRYLWINIESNISLSSASLNSIIENKILYLYGVKGAVEIGYRLIEYDPEESNAILRCFHNRLNEFRSALAHIYEIQGTPARVDVKLVSGTIKSLRKRF